jgi:hypothetical protein
MFLISVRAGLRAKEIASLTWAMLTDAEGKIGDAIHLVDQASKGASGRVIPLNRELKAALVQIQNAQVGGRASPFVVTTERAKQTSAAAIVNLFAVWYRGLGFNGCSSHSGRRGFITNAARKIGTVGGSLKGRAGPGRTFIALDHPTLHRSACRCATTDRRAGLTSPRALARGLTQEGRDVSQCDT